MQHSARTARCTCTPVVGSRFGGDTSRGPAEAIIETVAAAEGVDPTELAPIHDEIDLESVEQLFSTERPLSTRPLLFECSILGWNVYVRGDGAIKVCDPEQVTDPEPVFEKALWE